MNQICKFWFIYEQSIPHRTDISAATSLREFVLVIR